MTFDLLGIQPGSDGIDGEEGASIPAELLEIFLGLEPAAQAGVLFGLAIFLGTVVLGIFPSYSEKVVWNARKSPIVSALIGIPGTLSLITILGLAAVIAEYRLGVFFAIPMVAVGMTLLPAWTGLGMSIIGGSIAKRLGFNQTPVAVLVGAIIVGLSAFVPALLFITVSLAAFLGVGAGARTMFGSQVSTHPEERSVPPANQM